MKFNILGVNSGTSMDGIDLSLVEFKQKSPTSPLYLREIKYDEILFEDDVKRDCMKFIGENDCSPQQLCELNFRLGTMYANAIDRYIKDHNIDLEHDIDLISSHGHTIWHQPNPKKGETKSTLQMGEPSILAHRFGKTVVTDFRAAEQVVGRQGAPLANFQDALALVHPTLTRASQNIGGIANVAFVPAERDGGIARSYDFDTGPGNILIDAAVRHFTHGQQEYDKDGKMGAQGRVDQDIVDEYMRHPYFTQPVPKTTGRELFGDDSALRIIEQGQSKGMSANDIVATITRITAEAILVAYERFGPGKHVDEIYFCGGGSYNPNILAHIQSSLPTTRLSLLESCGISASSKEATSFAFMGLECLLGRPMIVPVTEIQTPVVTGKITPGRNYGGVIRRVAEFRGLVVDVEGTGEVNVANETWGWGGEWLPVVRDLRVCGNMTRDKEIEDRDSNTSGGFAS